MPTHRRTAQLFEFQTLVYKSRMTLKDVLVRIHSSACSDELSQYRLNVVEEVLDVQDVARYNINSCEQVFANDVVVGAGGPPIRS